VLCGVRGVAKAGMTMIIVTHEVLYAREVADRIVFVDDGVIGEQGPRGRLLDDPVHERTRRFLRGVAYEEDIAA
jgi:ABC-type polar amino acid transport system ATPase subunit